LRRPNPHIIEKIKKINISLFIFGLLSFNNFAQDLEPRILSTLPTGANFAIASYSFSTGNILVDNSLPIEGLESRLNNIVFAYARSFKLFNKLAKFDVILPYSFANFSGKVSEIDSTTSRTGFADPLFRISMIFIGAEPYTLKEYMKHKPKKFKMGGFIRIRPPLGNYDNTKLLNLGANRWALRTGIGISYIFSNKIILEAQANTWLFTENKEFFNGNTISQKPLLSAQIHFTYILKPGIWISASMGRSGLGETTINGIEQDDLQKNSRYGLTFAYRLNKHSSLKAAYTSGITTRYGSDFTTFVLAYQYMWLDKPKK
jgi:hypothetical protein